MTQPRPTASELLDAVRGLLHDEVLPTLDGRLRFHTRVAVNVLELVIRELREGPAADAAEQERLLALLGPDPDPDPDQQAGAAGATGEAVDVDALGRALAGAIRRGELDGSAPTVVAHLRATARADVAIANPRWLDPPGPGDGPP